MKITKKLVVIIAIILTLVIVSIFVYLKTEKKLPVVNNENAQLSSNEQGDWKNYSLNNFSFKYPSNWYVENTTDDKTLRVSNYSEKYLDDYKEKNGALMEPADAFAVYINLNAVGKDASIEEYFYNSADKAKANSEESVVVNGIQGIKYSYTNISGIGGLSKPNSTHYVLKQGEHIVDVSYGYGDSVINIVPVADMIVNSITVK